MEVREKYMAFDDGYIMEDYYLKPGKWGIMDRNSKKQIVEPKYAYEPIFLYEDRILVCLNDGWHYNDLRNYYECFDKKWGIVTFDGKEVLPIEYDHISPFLSEGHYYYICKKEKWGVLNEEFKEVIPFEFDRIECARCYHTQTNQPKMLVVTKDSLEELRDLENNVLIPKGKYDRIFPIDFSSDRIVVMNKNDILKRYDGGLYDYKKQEEIIDVKYWCLMFIDDHLLQAYINDYDTILFNIDGEVIDTGEFKFERIYIAHNDKKHEQYAYHCYCNEGIVYFNITPNNEIDYIVEEYSNKDCKFESEEDEDTDIYIDESGEICHFWNSKEF